MDCAVLNRAAAACVQEINHKGDWQLVHGRVRCLDEVCKGGAVGNVSIERAGGEGRQELPEVLWRVS